MEILISLRKFLLKLYLWQELPRCEHSMLKILIFAFLQPWRVNYKIACEYINDGFKDPSSFTVVIVGNLEPSLANPLILEYLGGIPKSTSPIFHFDYDTLIKVYFIALLSQLLTTKMTEVLRFQHGQIYSVSVSSDFDYNKPSRTEDLCGDINISFSCNPEASDNLVEIALNEIMRLQEQGPSEEDVSSVLEIEQRAYEMDCSLEPNILSLQENYQWLFRVLMSYLSRFYSGDVGSVFKALNKSRIRVRQSLNPLTAKWALQRILPNPCKDCFAAVTLVPETNRLRLLKNKISHFKPTDLAIYSKSSEAVSARALYSASVEERATDRCFLELHDIGLVRDRYCSEPSSIRYSVGEARIVPEFRVRRVDAFRGVLTERDLEDEVELQHPRNRTNYPYPSRRTYWTDSESDAALTPSCYL
ncbi:hypothetical protein V2J09_011603 [Rumex salicifolius]